MKEEGEKRYLPSFQEKIPVNFEEKVIWGEVFM
jgi:hypothetical protein